MTKPILDLDFDGIKAEIIAFVKANPTFSDYNFEGSALNAITDLLAFNTHANAFLASMAHNEGFSETAQKRGSVVSKAKEKGYTPRSFTGAIAQVNVSAVGAVGTQFLPRGTPFSSSNENGTFDFLVLNDTASVNVSGVEQFTNLSIKNGIRLTNYFVVDTTSNVRSLFSIPNSDVDTSTLKVYVRDSQASTSRTEYTLAENAYGLTGLSTVFFLQEGYDGKFQIYFGSDVIGKQPVNGNLVEIDYFVSPETSSANDCSIFTLNGSIGNATSVTVTTVQSAIGGSEKEDIDSIVLNANKSNSAKERTVSVPDYELSLAQKFPFIKSSAIWGGEDNVPPVYGKVFVSVQPVSGYTISEDTKRNILTPEIRKNGILTVIPEIVDPDYIFLSFVTKIKFNKAKSVATQEVVEGLVKTKVSSYISAKSMFNTDYLQSDLEGQIKALDPGIVSVAISKSVGFKVAPLIDVETTYSKNIANRIVGGTIGSTKFTVVSGASTALVSIKEITSKNTTITTSNGVIQQIASLGTYTDSGELINEIGTVNLTTGQFSFSLSVLSYISNNRFVNIAFTLADDDVETVRNQIITMDSVSGDSSIGLVNNNQVITELYDKNV